jgi:hypothetical protein
MLQGVLLQGLGSGFFASRRPATPMHAFLIATMRIIFPAHLILLDLTVVIKYEDKYGTNYNARSSLKMCHM